MDMSKPEANFGIGDLYLRQWLEGRIVNENLDKVNEGYHSALEEIGTNSDNDMDQSRVVQDICSSSGSVENLDEVNEGYHSALEEIGTNSDNDMDQSRVVQDICSSSGSVENLDEVNEGYHSALEEIGTNSDNDMDQSRVVQDICPSSGSVEADGDLQVSPDVSTSPDASNTGFEEHMDVPDVSNDEQESSRIQPQDDDNQSSYFADTETSCGSHDSVGYWSDLQVENADVDTSSCGSFEVDSERSDSEGSFTKDIKPTEKESPPLNPPVEPSSEETTQFDQAEDEEKTSFGSSRFHMFNPLNRRVRGPGNNDTHHCVLSWGTFLMCAVILPRLLAGFIVKGFLFFIAVVIGLLKKSRLVCAQFCLAVGGTLIYSTNSLRSIISGFPSSINRYRMVHINWFVVGILPVCLMITVGSILSGLLFNGPPKVCYGKYGCFNKQPKVQLGLIRIQPSLPQNPNVVGTTFDMYTRNGHGRVNDHDADKLKAPKFDIARRTIFVIHGWGENTTKGWTIELKDALLQREDCNVILVDWSGGAKTSYGQSVGNTRLVGAQTAELIRFLIKSASGPPDLAKMFYIVGFSLGGQTAGYAGSYLKEKARMTLGRITGLDPAGPYFDGNADPRFRLDPSDAEYVDVIHTDMHKSGSLVGFGMRDEAGHADFFPNGGIDQCGCLRHLVKLEFIQTVKCDHQRAWRYYIASVNNPRSWKARPCRDYKNCENGKTTACVGECPSMGYGADKTKPTGKFYLKTSAQAPFHGLSSDASVERNNMGSGVPE